MILTKDLLSRFSKKELIEIIMLNEMQPANSINQLKESSIISTKIIDDYKWSDPRATKIININGKKFKIIYDNSNGSPLGFNYKFSASVMMNDGNWKYVAEKKDIDWKSDVSYISHVDNRKRDSLNFINDMQKYLEKVYG